MSVDRKHSAIPPSIKNTLGQWAALALWLPMLITPGLPSPAAAAAKSADWPMWRGSRYGTSLEQKLPVYWDSKTNVAWRTVVPGEGNSSPIIYGNQLFLTASRDKGKTRSVFSINAETGKIEWETKLTAGHVAETSTKNGYASPTPVCDGQRVYVFFDSPGLAALDLKGKLLWTRDLGQFKTPWNMASSPALCGDKVILVCDNWGPSFIVAVDKKTGKICWKTTRKSDPVFGTPIVVQVGGKPQIITNGTKVVAYDPSDGKEIWSCAGLQSPNTPTPLFAGGLVYATCGRNGPTLAIDPSGKGDVTDTKVKMHLRTAGPMFLRH